MTLVKNPHPVFTSATKEHLAVSQVLGFLVGDAGFEPTAFGSGELNKVALKRMLRIL